jgi:hypothetical protein
METKAAIVFLKTVYAFMYEATHGNCYLKTVPSDDLKTEEYLKVLEEINRAAQESHLNRQHGV